LPEIFDLQMHPRTFFPFLQESIQVAVVVITSFLGVAWEGTSGEVVSSAEGATFSVLTPDKLWTLAKSRADAAKKRKATPKRRGAGVFTDFIFQIINLTIPGSLILPYMYPDCPN